MRALIDADILRYEVGFASQTGWKAITGKEEEVPPFDYVEDLLLQRIQIILNDTNSDSYCLYITEGPTFRYEIWKTREYKGTRKDNKPWHFNNITAYIKGLLPHKVVTYIEADDALAMDNQVEEDTILCSRDKDLRMVPGLFYSWELGKQPSFGPLLIDNFGYIDLTENKKIRGIGFAFFCSQLLTGDVVDNIPGINGYGPVKAYEIIDKVLDSFSNNDDEELKAIALMEQIKFEYASNFENWEEMLLEQGQLLWVVRELDKEGLPKLWQIGTWK